MYNYQGFIQALILSNPISKLKVVFDGIKIRCKSQFDYYNRVWNEIYHGRSLNWIFKKHQFTMWYSKTLSNDAAHLYFQKMIKQFWSFSFKTQLKIQFFCRWTVHKKCLYKPLIIMCLLVVHHGRNFQKAVFNFHIC